MTQRRRPRSAVCGLWAAHALKVEEQLAADGVDHGAAMAEGYPRSRAHHARLKQRVGHARDCFHSQDGFTDGGRGHVVFAQGAQRS